MTVALMILIKAAFTLPGPSGPRADGRYGGRRQRAHLRAWYAARELERGSARCGWQFATAFRVRWAQFWTPNVTTLITAVVLYMIGTDQIKGFAVTLILGLLV